jgi:hypothetical protein
MFRILGFLIMVTLLMLFGVSIAAAATMTCANPAGHSLLLTLGGALAVGMALSVDTPRTFESGNVNEFGVLASSKIYEGSAVGDSGTGYVRALVAGDTFRGFAERLADNSAVATNGAINVRVVTKGLISLAVTSLVITDVGKPVYASDDGTFLLSAGTENTYIGTVYRFVSSGVGIVAFDASQMAWGDKLNSIASQLLPGMRAQGIHEASTTQRYPLGTILRYPDGRKFAYSKAGGTLIPDISAKCANIQQINWAAVVSGALNATTMVITVGSGDGLLANGAVALNELAGGHIMIMPNAGNITIHRGIVGNTATVSTGPMTITLDDPLPVLLTSSDHCEAMGSEFLNVTSTTQDTKSGVGQPMVPATVGQYCWLLVEGVTWLAPDADVSVGSNNRQVVLRHSGAIADHDYSDANAAKAQHLGYVITNAYAGGQGAPFIKARF